MNNSDLNEKTKSKATKAELKLEQNKIVELQTHDLSYFHGFQNIFVYQPIFNILKLKKAKALIMLLVRNQEVCVNLNFFRYMMLSYLT